MRGKKVINLKERLENFLDSDSGSAQVTKVVLAVLAIAGIFFVAVTSPNIFQIFGKYKRSFGYSDKQIKNAFYALKRRGFIEVLQEKNGLTKVLLTKKGKKVIKEFSIETISILKPKRWDKKWRVVIFDIPNKFNTSRAALRDKVRELGFLKLQKSVWVYPYSCEDEILFIADCFKVEPFLEILTVDSFLREENLKTHFDLQ